MVTIRIEHEHRIAARQRLSLRLNPLLCAGGSWFSTRGRALLGLQVGQPLCTGQAQQVWKNASLPWFGRLGCPELGRRNRLALWALCHDPEPSRALRRTGCGGIQPAKNRMGFAQGCFLAGLRTWRGSRASSRRRSWVITYPLAGTVYAIKSAAYANIEPLSPCK